MAGVCASNETRSDPPESAQVPNELESIRNALNFRSFLIIWTRIRVSCTHVFTRIYERYIFRFPCRPLRYMFILFCVAFAFRINGYLINTEIE